MGRCSADDVQEAVKHTATITEKYVTPSFVKELDVSHMLTGSSLHDYERHHKKIYQR